MFWNSKKKLKILAFDGGAEKGEISIKIAKALESQLKKIEPQKNLIEYFDVATGNSIGSVIASCLVIPSDNNPKKSKYTVDECIKIFNKALKSVNISISIWDKLSLILGFKNNVLTEKDVSFIYTICGNTKLSQTVIPIAIVSYDIYNNAPRVWSTLDAKSDSKKDFYLKDAIMASISYPGLFDPRVTKTEDKILKDYDGCLVSASPLPMVLPHIFNKENNITKEESLIVSIGTTIGNATPILADMDKNLFMKNMYQIYKMSTQIQKKPFDKLMKTFIKQFYKLDFSVPFEIQQEIYDKAKKGDLLDFSKMIACTNKYIDLSKEFFQALANQIADKKQNIEKLEVLYEKSAAFYCENTVQVLAEYGDDISVDPPGDL
ncbi:patatin-like phospholipase family protein [Candidatus Bandiella numerosa]|uniref:patatin-like phospholipase family protein n=1 Tax=Candidatus Bandiella numerosa TaxID=2570586 RepID=UPI00249EC46F|nr:patatin-like phospholipase family protein [Candidatus Bandiella numerosa]WHA05262.1 patatin-like phospholipase family protein [Candidatus Bandiella numerosa]